MGFSTGGANVSAAATRGGKGEIGVSVKFFSKEIDTAFRAMMVRVEKGSEVVPKLGH